MDIKSLAEKARNKYQIAVGDLARELKHKRGRLDAELEKRLETIKKCEELGIEDINDLIALAGPKHQVSITPSVGIASAKTPPEARPLSKGAIPRMRAVLACLNEGEKFTAIDVAELAELTNGAAATALCQLLYGTDPQIERIGLVHNPIHTHGRGRRKIIQWRKTA